MLEKNINLIVISLIYWFFVLKDTKTKTKNPDK